MKNGVRMTMWWSWLHAGGGELNSASNRFGHSALKATWDLWVMVDNKSRDMVGFQSVSCSLSKIKSPQA